VLSFTSLPLYPVEITPKCALGRRLDGTQARYGRLCNRKIVLALTGAELQFPDFLVYSLVAVVYICVHVNN
jgi:hypothetical protein